ncbi:MAG: YIP1 family protein [Halioglobus sp.]|nr:YIP1 family protein [Halioglobus sp.]
MDLQRTLTLARGALLDPEPTWRGYLPEAGDWQHTAALLTVPLIVASTIAAYLLGFLGSGVSLFGQFRPTLGSSLLGIVSGAVAIGVVAFIFSFFAGVFGGRKDFALSLAALTLAFVPGYVGQAIAWLPWIGGLLAFGLGIYALVLLWRIVPIYLEVPGDKRVLHYIVSLLSSLVCMLLISSLVATLSGHSGAGAQRYRDGAVKSPIESTGLFGGMARQGQLVEAAENDEYQAPANGKVSEDQVEELIRVMDRTRELREQQTARLKAISDKADQEGGLSISDFGAMMSGAQNIAGLQTAEIEVVKSGGGNWAEHQWVKNTLRTAWIQKDGSAAIQHNYRLYQQYEDKLQAYITP